MPGQVQFQDREKLCVYFEREELERLRKYAQKRGMGMSQWIRRLALHYMVRDAR